MEHKFIQNSGLGFFSDTFNLLHAYMVCKRDNIPFYVNSSEWTFGHWADYFTSLTERGDHKVEKTATDCGDADRQFRVIDYKDGIREVFTFQPYLLEKAYEVISGDYVAIFIRRGDKLLGEALYIPAEHYVTLALQNNPKIIFVQTDDYRAYLEIREIVASRCPEVQVITTCPTNKLGFFYNSLNIHTGRCCAYMIDNKLVSNTANIEYLVTVAPQKPLTEFTAEETRAHVEEMLVGIIICQRAKTVVLDHMSNVSRFIAFSHPGGKEAIQAIEDMNIMFAPNVPLMPRYNYTDEKYIRNPRYHSIYNDYI